MAESILLEDAIKKSFEFCIVKNMTGKTKLSDLVDEFGFITQMITIDSGINHLGRLLGVPIVSYWGPSDPSLRLNQVDASIETNLYQKISCSPCVHLIDNPPCSGNNLCMKIHLDSRVEISPIWKVQN